MLWIRITLMRIRIRLITLMRIILLIFIWCGSGFLFDSNADPDLTYADTDPKPDHSFLIKAQTLKKVLKQAGIPYILACHRKLMRIRIFIWCWCGSWLTKMMRIRIQNIAFWFSVCFLFSKFSKCDSSLEVHKNIEGLQGCESGSGFADSALVSF